MAGWDRISELPESLLTHVLSYLPTKDSVKTSVLSKRWESVWRRVPGLDLKYNDFPEEFPPHDQSLESLVNKFLESNKESRMQTFKIQFEYEQCDDDQLVVWIDKAVDRGVQHLYVETEKAPNITQSIYTSNTLVSLTLLSVGLESPKNVVSLPCLKMMHIEDV
ncbi:unnamed protein product [Microthlaspi erraticum]|uniref:F-box domain-containing protein n=1 Tax=Microthlaspi erraticum TaxID=1685480 RepID=A0A6D2HJK0_9BRAS|nr:unnamed protein product [Microthlaspi erraticum]